MSISPATSEADPCTFHEVPQSPYLRLQFVIVFVRDQERSLRFYVDQLGFSVVLDVCRQSDDRWITVTPPDGTAVVALITPKPGSEEQKLIGRHTQVVFLAEDVNAMYHNWCARGVRFHQPPQTPDWGGTFTSFEDVDGNTFMLVGFDQATREVEEHRRAATEKLESERRTAQELEVAKQVQARLFPQTLPPLKTLDYAGACIQARHVGGDYYDFLDLGRGRLGLVLADISGKGTAAALLMANLQAHLHNQTATYWSRPYTPFALDQPERFLRSVNQLFYENTTEDAYATLFFAEYDDNAQQLRYANCGHVSALLLRSDKTLERLDSTSTVLGLFKQWNCPTGEYRLFSGDTLALYTDGITESFNERGEEFGEQRLIETLRRHRELPSSALLASILGDVQQFNPHEQHDDISLIVAKCTAN